MSPRTRSLVSLVVIALALAATALAWRLAPPPAPPPSALLEPVFDFPAGAVRAISLESWQGGLVARRTDAGWQVDEVRLGRSSSPPEPGQARPAQAEVDATLDALVADIVATPQIDRFDAAGVPLADFGLDHPQARVTLQLATGGERTLEVGELTITTAALYARVLPSEDVFQIGTLVFNNMAAALYRLRAFADVAPPEGAP